MQRVRAKAFRKYTEVQVDHALTKVCKEVGALTFKNHPMTEKGIPDRIIHAKGKTFYVELKATLEECSEIQKAFHKRLKEAGIETFVLDTKIENFYDLWVYAYTTYPSPHYKKNPHITAEERDRIDRQFSKRRLL